MSKNYKKKWWYDKYDFDDEFYKKEQKKDDDFSSSSWWKTSYKNPTKSWMSKLGGYTYSFGESSDEKYHKVLKQLQTSINIINNNDIVVKWSDNTNKNKHDDNIVYLSPNNLLKGGEIDDNEIDVLTGEVYLSRMIKEQSNKDYDAKKTVSESALWKALEINIAKTNLEKDWPGFIPNVLKNLDNKNCDKTKVENVLNAETVSIEAITSGLSWNLVNPHDMVEIPEKYNACLDAASEILADDKVEYNRLDACKQIIKKIKEILGVDEDFEKDLPAPKLERLFGEERISNTIGEGLKNQSAESKTDDLGSPKVEGTLAKQELYAHFTLMKNRRIGIYEKQARELTNQINHIKNNLMFMDNKMHNHSFGHLSGDIDENSLFKIKLKDERLMSRPDILSRKQNAFCFLLDESGSMGCHNRISEARKVLITLTEALKDKFNISVYGHTAEGNAPDGRFIRGTIINEYYSPRNSDYKSIIEAKARHQNFDGMAIKQCGKRLLQDYPESRKILFHIADGKPYTNYMYGEKAEQYVKEVSDELKKKGVEVYCIGICNAFHRTEGEKMYGKDRFVIINDVASSVGILSRFIQQICNKSIAAYVQS
ncbi:MAG: VWA domain-containing protein [Candidatus Kapaibacterium sp.]